MLEQTDRPVMVGTYIPRRIHLKLKRLAKGERRSVAAFLALLIEKEVDKRRGGKAA